jgi:hypothetical protein
MVRTFLLQKSDRPDKKFMIDEYDNDEFKTVYFGSAPYSDYTINKNPLRKKAYIQRHRSRENWSKSGIDTAGFFARWLLWNQPTLEDSIKDIENRFNIEIKLID